MARKRRGYFLQNSDGIRRGHSIQYLIGPWRDGFGRRAVVNALIQEEDYRKNPIKPEIHRVTEEFWWDNGMADRLGRWEFDGKESRCQAVQKFVDLSRTWEQRPVMSGQLSVDGSNSRFFLDGELKAGIVPSQSAPLMLGIGMTTVPFSTLSALCKYAEQLFMWGSKLGDSELEEATEKVRTLVNGLESGNQEVWERVRVRLEKEREEARWDSIVKSERRELAGLSRMEDEVLSNVPASSPW